MSKAIAEPLSETAEYVAGAAKLTKEATAVMLDALVNDPHRRPFEKETRVMFSRDGARADVCTADRPVAKRCLCHPEFALSWFEYADPEDDRRTFQGEPSDVFDTWDGQPVYAVSGTVPIGCVLVKGDARADSGTAATVSRSVMDNDPREGGESL